MTTKSDFDAILANFDATNRINPRHPQEFLARRALRAAWFFIENVTDDDPAKTELFFRVRELVWQANV